MSKEEQVDTAYRIIWQSLLLMLAKKLPDDVIAKLEELRRERRQPTYPKQSMILCLRNQELAVKLNRPSCQDTGVLTVLGKMRNKIPTDR